MFKIRRVLEEMETSIQSFGDSQITGRCEWKRYGNGDLDLKIRLFGLGAYVGTPLNVQIAGTVFLTWTPKQDNERHTLDLADRSDLPHVRKGDILNVLDGETVIAIGDFYED